RWSAHCARPKASAGSHPCASAAAKRSPWPSKWCDPRGRRPPAGARRFLSLGTAMPVVPSRGNPRSQAIIDNAAAMQAQVDDLKQQLERTAKGGSEAARAKHVARGKLLPRDRVERLLDPGAPFLELSPMAAHNVYGNDAPGAGLICGIGRV